MYPKPRSGLTLIELLIASATATILMGGLSVSIYVASQAVDEGDSGIVAEIRSSSAVEDILADLRVTRKVLSRSPSSIVCVVPDRTGDGVDDVLTYQWSGTAGDPLTRQLNDSAVGTILPNVQSLNFNYFTRSVTGIPQPDVGPSSNLFVRSAKDTVTKRKYFGTLELPDDVEAGDLLIASVCANFDQKGSIEQFADSSDWHRIIVTTTGYETLGLLYKIADGTEQQSYKVNYGSRADSYAYSIAIGGVDPTLPFISLSRSYDGRSSNPRANEVATLKDAMVLRFLCIDDNSITENDAGVDDHETIVAGAADYIGGAAAFMISEDDETAPRAYFTLRSSEYYITHSLSVRSSE